MSIKFESFKSSAGGGGAVTSVNTQTGVVVVSGDDIVADHTAVNYTAADANIDGHLSGIDTKLGTIATGLTYKGAFNATAGTPSIANALQGDLYVIDTVGTIYGQTWAIGDHLLINADMGGSVTNSKIDKIDNTDQVTSVNTQTGTVVVSGDDIVADHTAVNYTAVDANIDGHLSGIDTKFGTLGTASTASSSDFLVVANNLSDLNNASTARTNLGLGTAAVEAVGTTAGDVVQLDGSARLPAVDGSQLTGLASAPVTSVNTQTGVVVVSGDDIVADHTAVNYTAADANIDGHLSGIDTKLGTLGTPTLDTVTTAGSTTTNSITIGGAETSGDITANTNLTRTIGEESTRFITYYGDVNGAVRFKAKNDSGVQLTKGTAVYIKGVSGTVPTVDKADSDNASAMPAFGLVYANANDQAEVQIVSFGNLEGVDTSSFSAGDTLYVSTTPGTLTTTPPTSEAGLLQNIGRVVRSDASDGVIIVGGAGRTAATPNLNDGKIFLGNVSNQAVSTALSTIDLSSFNNDLTIPSALNDLSDVTITAAASNEYLRYSGSAWVDASLGIVDDTTPSLGGDLDTNDNEIITASNRSVILRPNGTGFVHLGGNTNPAELRLYCQSGDVHYSGFKAAVHASYGTSVVWELPTADGTTGQVLQTNGSAVLSFVDQSGGGGGGFTYSAITADPANAQANYHYSCGAGNETFTITLPTSGVSAGEEIRIKNMGTGTITIDPQTQTIDSSSDDYVLDVKFSAITLVSTGSNWEII